MHFLRIPPEIQQEIASLCGRPGNIALARVCKTLLRIARPEILRDVDLVRCPDQVQQFCHFILRDKNSRSCYIQTLKIRNDAAALFTRRLQAVLQEVLAGARNLRCFYLARTTKIHGIWGSDITISAICRLSSLSELHLRDVVVHQSHSGWLRQLCGLRRLVLVAKGDLDLSHALHASRDTLEEVTYRAESPLQDPVQWRPLPQTFDGAWPKVRSLTLVCNVSLPNVMGAFPCARRITLSPPRGTRATMSAPDRGAHVSQDRAHWSTLDHLQADVGMLAQWRFPCFVRYLKLTAGEHGASPTELRDILGRHRPSVLVLSAWYPGPWNLLNYAELFQTLEGQALELKALVLVDSDGCLVERLEGCLSLINSDKWKRLEYFQMNQHSDEWNDGRNGRERPSKPSHDRRPLPGYHLRSAQIAFETFPHLRYFHIVDIHPEVFENVLVNGVKRVVSIIDKKRARSMRASYMGMDEKALRLP